MPKRIQQTLLTYNYIYLILVLLSFVLFYFSTNNTLPNKDGLLYLSTAETYLTKGFQAALTQYHWPFYPILIASISKLTHLSLLYSAYLTNVIFQIIICLSLLRIGCAIYPSNNNYLGTSIAVALLLFFIFPRFNEYRDYIIRDHGFWAFSLLAILNLIHFYHSQYSLVAAARNKRLNFDYCWFFNKNLILYYFCFMLAFLFRGEGLVIALMLPWSVLFTNYSRAAKKQLLLRIYFPVIICTSVALIFILFLYSVSTSNEHNLLNSLYINLHFNKLDHIFKTYASNHASMNSYIFIQTPLNSSAAVLFFAFGLFGVFLMKLLSCLGLAYAILLILFSQIYLSQNHQKYLAHTEINNLRIVLFSALLLLCLPLGFLYIIFVTAGRYYVLPSFLLILLLPVSIEYLRLQIKNLHHSHNTKYLITGSTVLMVILIAMSGLVSSGYSKDYIKQAAEWYHTNSLPNDSRAISNHSELNYLANLSVPHKEHLDLKTQTHEYVLLKIKAKDRDAWNNIALLESQKRIIVLRTFYNQRQDSVFIIKQLK